MTDETVPHTAQRSTENQSSPVTPPIVVDPPETGPKPDSLPRVETGRHRTARAKVKRTPKARPSRAKPRPAPKPKAQAMPAGDLPAEFADHVTASIAAYGLSRAIKNPVDSAIILDRAEATSAAIVRLAAENVQVRRVINLFLDASAISQAVTALLLIGAPLAANHGINLPIIGGMAAGYVDGLRAQMDLPSLAEEAARKRAALQADEFARTMTVENPPESTSAPAPGAEPEFPR